MLDLIILRNENCLKCGFLHDGIFPFTGEYFVWSVHSDTNWFRKYRFLLFILYSICVWDRCEQILATERCNVDFLLDDSSGRDESYFQSNLTCNGTYEDRRVVVNYACVLPILVHPLCLLSRKAHLKQTSGISGIYCNLFMPVQNLHEFFRHNRGNFCSVFAETPLAVRHQIVT